MENSEKRKKALEEQIVSTLIEGKVDFSHMSRLERYNYAYRVMTLVKDYCCEIVPIPKESVKLGFLDCSLDTAGLFHKSIVKGETIYYVSLSDELPLFTSPYEIFSTAFHEMRHVMQDYIRDNVYEPQTSKGIFSIFNRSSYVEQSVSDDDGTSSQIPFVVTIPISTQSETSQQETSTTQESSTSGVRETLSSFFKPFNIAPKMQAFMEALDEAAKEGYDKSGIVWLSDPDEADAEKFALAQMAHFSAKAMLKNSETRVSFAADAIGSSADKLGLTILQPLSVPVGETIILGRALTSPFRKNQPKQEEHPEENFDEDSFLRSALRIEDIEDLARSSPSVFLTRDYEQGFVERKKVDGKIERTLPPDDAICVRAMRDRSEIRYNVNKWTKRHEQIKEAQRLEKFNALQAQLGTQISPSISYVFDRPYSLTTYSLESEQTQAQEQKQVEIENETQPQETTKTLTPTIQEETSTIVEKAPVSLEVKPAEVPQGQGAKHPSGNLVKKARRRYVPCRENQTQTFQETLEEVYGRMHLSKPRTRTSSIADLRSEEPYAQGFSLPADFEHKIGGAYHHVIDNSARRPTSGYKRTTSGYQLEGDSLAEGEITSLGSPLRTISEEASVLLGSTEKTGSHDGSKQTGPQVVILNESNSSEIGSDSLINEHANEKKPKPVLRVVTESEGESVSEFEGEGSSEIEGGNNGEGSNKKNKKPQPKLEALQPETLDQNATDQAQCIMYIQYNFELIAQAYREMVKTYNMMVKTYNQMLETYYAISNPNSSSTTYHASTTPETKGQRTWTISSRDSEPAAQETLHATTSDVTPQEIKYASAEDETINRVVTPHIRPWEVERRPGEIAASPSFEDHNYQGLYEMPEIDNATRIYESNYTGKPTIAKSYYITSGEYSVTDYTLEELTPDPNGHIFNLPQKATIYRACDVNFIDRSEPDLTQ